MKNRVLVLAIALALAASPLGCAKRTRPSEKPDRARPSRTATATATETAQATEPPAFTDDPSDTPSSETPPEEGTSAEGVNERSLGYITSLKKSGTSWTVTVDYIQLLTGAAAEEAATADGAESPPPNDFYLRNQSTKLRTFPVAPGAKAVVVDAEDASRMAPPAAVADFASLLSRDAYRRAPYWLVVRGGVVVTIEQQYLP